MNTENNNLTHYRWTITLPKFDETKDESQMLFYNQLEKFLIENISKNIEVQRGGVFNEHTYRELKSNEYNVSLGRPQEIGANK